MKINGGPALHSLYQAIFLIAVLKLIYENEHQVCGMVIPVADFILNCFYDGNRWRPCATLTVASHILNRFKCENINLAEYTYINSILECDISSLSMSRSSETPTSIRTLRLPGYYSGCAIRKVSR